METVLKQHELEDVSGMRYVVASNGCFVERDTPLYQSSVSVNWQPPFLEEHNEKCIIKFRLEDQFMAEACGFLRAAYNMHKGEAALVLQHNPTTNQFRWFCPQQTVSSGYSLEVEFEWPAETDEWTNVGDIHSHPSFSPVPSHTDIGDEKSKDGLHIIVGDIDKKRYSYHATFVVDDKRFMCTTLVLGSDRLQGKATKPPKGWLDCITVEKRKWFGGGYQTKPMAFDILKELVQEIKILPASATIEDVIDTPEWRDAIDRVNQGF